MIVPLNKLNRLTHIFSKDELLKVCNKCKNGKSVGPDLLPNEILKCPLCILFY